MRTLIPVLSTLLLITIYACNDDNGTASDKYSIDTIEQVGKLDLDSTCNIGNMVIDSLRADTMRKHFDSVFRKPLTIPPKNALLDSFWIDKIIITQLADFLQKNDTIDGVRFWMGANENANESRYPNQVYKNESEIIIVLTSRQDAGINSKHKNEWDLKFGFNSPVPPSFTNFNLEKSNIDSKIKKFGAIYREETTPGEVGTGKLDSLSAAVWIDECVFFKLAALLNRASNNLDGINVLIGAYSRKEPLNSTSRGQLKADQSTVILVPTKNQVSDWQAVQNNYKILAGYAYNHGELCPQKCN